MVQTHSQKEKMDAEFAKKESTDVRVTKLETEVQNVTKAINDLKNLIVAMNMKINFQPSTLMEEVSTLSSDTNRPLLRTPMRERLYLSPTKIATMV